MNCDLWRSHGGILLNGLVFTFHCNFVSGICELKPFLQSAISFSRQSDPGEEGTFSRK